MVVAAGPFTTTQNIDFEPLKALLDYCLQHKPHVLLLMGPFVDVDHQLIQGGALLDTFEDVFLKQVSLHLAAKRTQACLLQISLHTARLPTRCSLHTVECLGLARVQAFKHAVPAGMHYVQ